MRGLLLAAMKSPRAWSRIGVVNGVLLQAASMTALARMADLKK
jgi:hypothetical protein